MPLKNIPFEQAIGIMLEVTGTMPVERVKLGEAVGRVLAADIRALGDMPPFDRSAYDGYALIAADTASASSQTPVTLQIIEEIPAGSVPVKKIIPGTAAKILTGAPLPPGANAVVQYEMTSFTTDTVTLDYCVSPGNIIRAGEDVSAGTLLAEKGCRVDPATAGTLAAQGVSQAMVFKRPRVGIISTGSEIIEADTDAEAGAGIIRNSNRYVLEGACRGAGAEPYYLGISADNAENIAALITKGLKTCDLILLTGGVSVGDYDLTPLGMELAGVELLIRKVSMKPGGSCAYGVKDGKPVFALSGNPGAAVTSFYVVALPCLRKLCGLGDYRHRKIKVTLADAFDRISKKTRLLRGRLDLTDGTVRMRLAAQGNVCLHAMIGCDVIAVIPTGSPPLPAGTELTAFMIS